MGVSVSEMVAFRYLPFLLLLSLQDIEDVHSWRIDAYAVYIRPFNNYFERYKQGLNPPVSSMIYPSYDLSRFSKRSKVALDPPMTRKPSSVSLPWNMNLHSPMLRGR